MKVTDLPSYILEILIWAIKKVNSCKKELSAFVGFGCSPPLPVTDLDWLTESCWQTTNSKWRQVQFNPHFNDDDSKTCVQNPYGELMDFQLFLL